MRGAVLMLVLGVVVSLGAQAQTIYRTTDAQGNVVFTDNPAQGGEKVELEPLTVVPSRPNVREQQATPRERRSEGATTSGPPFLPYDRFAIAEPREGVTLPTGAAGEIEVELDIEPALREDHRVRLLVDGEVSQSAMHTDTFLLTNLNRGEHVLEAELLDARGEVRHRSSPVTLYVQRASINLPQNPNNPDN